MGTYSFGITTWSETTLVMELFRARNTMSPEVLLAELQVLLNAAPELTGDHLIDSSAMQWLGKVQSLIARVDTGAALEFQVASTGLVMRATRASNACLAGPDCAEGAW